MLMVLNLQRMLQLSEEFLKWGSLGPNPVEFFLFFFFFFFCG